MAILSHTDFPLVGVQFKVSYVNQAAQNDKVVFNDAGLHLFACRLATGAAATITRNTITAAESATISASAVSIAYNGGTASARKAKGYYARIDNEIIYVGADSGSTATTGTLSGVVRGALGTTAATHASTSTITILNSFNLGDNQTAPVEFIWAAMPADPKGVDFYKTTGTPGSIPSVA